MFLIYLTGGLIPMLLVTSFLFHEMKKELLREVKQSEQEELYLISNEIKECLAAIEMVSSSLFYDKDLEAISSSIYTNDQEIFEDYSNFTKFRDNMYPYRNEIAMISIYMNNPTIRENSYFHYANEDMMKYREWYQNAKKANGKADWNYHYVDLYQSNFLCLNREVKKEDGSVVGILDISLNPDKLDANIKNRKWDTKILLNSKTIASNHGSYNEIDWNLNDILKDKTSAYISKVVYHDYKKTLVSVIRMNVKNTDDQLMIISYIPYEKILETVNSKRMQSIQVILIVFLVVLALIIAFASLYSHQMKRFRYEMHEAANGNFNLPESIGGKDEISLLYQDLNSMVQQMKELLEFSYAEDINKEKLLQRQKEVEFKMLASQINPHFLYNTLETIRMRAVISGQYEIEEITKMLVQILRRNVHASSEILTISEEIELVECYMKIQQHRFINRIHYKITCNEKLRQYKILPLLLQPIVENAVIHGLEMKRGGGVIVINVLFKDSCCIIRVYDNGSGMNEKDLEDVRAQISDFNCLDRTQIGLVNVNQRIKLFYGDEYGIEIDSIENKFTTVTIKIPYLS